METTTIKILKTTRELLKSFGKKGENYDEVINNLIAKLNKTGDDGTTRGTECG